MATHSIDNTTAYFMIATAVIIDLMQAGLDLIVIGIFLNPPIDLVVGAIFALWFWHLGVNMFSAKNFGPFLGTLIAESIPGINALPLWTMDVAFTIAQNRGKEKMSQG